MEKIKHPAGNLEGNPEDEVEDKKDKIESPTYKVDQIFDGLLDSVRNAPEAQKEALEILVGQIKQIGEQLKQTRDLKQLQELKKMMINHWQELHALVDGDEKMLQAVHNWADKFTEEKVLQYELIEGVKDELIEKAGEIQNLWSDTQIDLGRIQGLIDGGKHGVLAAWRLINNEIENYRVGGQNLELQRTSELDDYIISLTNLEQGFGEKDINLNAATTFISKLNRLARGLIALAIKPKYDGGGGYDKSPIDAHPELKSILDGFVEKIKQLSQLMKEVNSSYKFIKKIRDTHFLKLF